MKLLITIILIITLASTAQAQQTSTTLAVRDHYNNLLSAGHISRPDFWQVQLKALDEPATDRFYKLTHIHRMLDRLIDIPSAEGRVEMGRLLGDVMKDLGYELHCGCK